MLRRKIEFLLTLRLSAIAQSLKRRLALYRALIGDPRTPVMGKVLLGLAVGYALTPVDLIPGFFPIIGQLDDVTIIPALVFLAMRAIPAEIFREHESKIS